MTVGIIRHTRDHPCGACGGHSALPPKSGKRCYGFTTSDQRFIYCTREEYANGAPFHVGANAYMHRVDANGGNYAPIPPLPVPQRQLSNTPQIASPDTCDLVYSRYAELRPLSSIHRLMYANRSPADLRVALRYGYCSLPFGYNEAAATTEKLIAEFTEPVVATVPGFFYNKDGRLTTHTGTVTNNAAVIPLRDENNRIVAMLRHTSSGAVGKYRLFHRTPAKQVYTVAGPQWTKAHERDLWVPEGIHKAHLAAELGGIRVLGLPGSHLSDAHAQAIVRLAPDRVIEALDADKYVNKNVSHQRTHMHKRLLALDSVEVASAVWEQEEGKGLDDHLLAGRRPRLRTVARRPNVTARKPYPVPEPGPVPPSAPLVEVRQETQAEIDHFISKRRSFQGMLKVVAPPPGVGKSYATAAAIVQHGVTARIIVATKAKAQEYASHAPGLIRVVEGRNSANCANFEVADAARAKSYPVSKVVCETCPALATCRSTPGAYHHQFSQSGTLVGASPMLNSGEFLRAGELFVADDADLLKALVDDRDNRPVTTEDLLSILPVVGPGAMWDLLVLLADAVVTSKTAGDGLEGPAIGVRTWDAFARAAGGAERLRQLIEAAPPPDDLLPGNEDGDPVTVEDIEAAPPSFLALLLSLLRKELPAFLRGHEFNSGFSLARGRLTLAAFRQPIVDRRSGVPLLKERAVLVLDATPQAPLIERFATQNQLMILPSFAPSVTQPQAVKVIQIAEHFYGRSAITRTRKRRDGTEERPGRIALLASLERAQRDYPGDRPAVLCAKSLKPDVVALGFEAARVLTFYGNRGLNSIADCDVLYVLGRPQAPDQQALRLANLLHQGESPIRPHMTMSEVAYTGYSGPDGQGRAITIPTFEDPRAAACLEAGRTDELLQSVHRGRLFLVADPQIGLFDSAETGIARNVQQRRGLKLVLLTAQPVPGLRVDDLIYDPVGADHNAQRHGEALRRVNAAVTELEADGVPATIAAVARATGASRNTVAVALREIADMPRGQVDNISTDRLREVSTNLSGEGVGTPQDLDFAAAGSTTRPEMAVNGSSGGNRSPGTPRGPSNFPAERSPVEA